ncbi:helix-turn-helix domain-containing protein [Paenibacillus sp. SN-8-1]|uniref:helix-turn-helix domain-containing protein n=1 Tax=Paenibacillus sp. SN-8-1 TaxID=3435409 RepID=UPI003D9A697B
MSVTGNRIKELREKRKITQLELASRLGMNNSVLSRIEAGKRPVEDNELIKIADFFDVDTDFILGRTDSPRRSGYIDEIDTRGLSEFEEFINNPEHGIFFKDYLSAPEERKEEMRQIFKILQEKEKGRKPGDEQGE